MELMRTTRSPGNKAHTGVANMIKLLAFDLDDTLAPSKCPQPPAMAQALRRCLEELPVCVISGAQYPQFQTQVIGPLQDVGANLANLHLMPTCGTVYLRCQGGRWVEQYRHDLPEDVRAQAKELIKETAEELGYWINDPAGEIIEDRGTQLTYSALGQDAPLEEKRKWDPTGEKKIAMRQALSVKLPQLQVRAGGSTSVDITAQGIDKAYGMGQLLQATGLGKDEVLFIGDRLDPDGNDYPVKAAGYPTHGVSGWEDTVKLVLQLLDQRS